MDSSNSHIILHPSFDFRKLYIMTVWLSGLLAGIFFSVQNKDLVLPMMYTSFTGTSLLNLLIAVTFPFVVSGLILYFTTSWFLLPIIFFKAFLFSYCSCFISIAFVDAGWLLRWLFLFSSSFNVFFLLWFWFITIACDKSHIAILTFIFTSIAIIIAVIDYLIVLPFTALLLN